MNLKGSFIDFNDIFNLMASYTLYSSKINQSMESTSSIQMQILNVKITLHENEKSLVNSRPVHID